MTPPIYRARRKDGTEFVEGWYTESYAYGLQCYIFISDESGGDEFIEIDPSTLAISFEDMTDKNGKRIFAALNESGVGGSFGTDDHGNEWRCIFNGDDMSVCFIFEGVEAIDFDISCHEWAEATGIYKGDHQ